MREMLRKRPVTVGQTPLGYVFARLYRARRLIQRRGMERAELLRGPSADEGYGFTVYALWN
jgi:hypothetical protein